LVIPWADTPKCKHFVRLICAAGEGGAWRGSLNSFVKELIPLVEMDFRAKPEGRALFGHSCGGDFAFYALLEGEGTFERVIAGSPEPRLIRQLESDYAKSHDSLRAQLFVSTGLLLDGPFPENPSDFKEFVTVLNSRNYSELQMKTAYFEDETHITVIPATIGRGLRAVYEGFPGARILQQAPN
jgi:hypothetical protein